nr:hypothetical protein [uncultured Eudoraea sp.]
MINCEKASTICNKKQYKEATLFEQIQLGFHLLYCKACAAFSKKNKKLTILCERAYLHNLSELEKEKMKEKIEHNI